MVSLSSFYRCYLVPSLCRASKCLLYCIFWCLHGDSHVVVTRAYLNYYWFHVYLFFFGFCCRFVCCSLPQGTFKDPCTNCARTRWTTISLIDLLMWVSYSLVNVVYYRNWTKISILECYFQSNFPMMKCFVVKISDS